MGIREITLTQNIKKLKHYNAYIFDTLLYVWILFFYTISEYNMYHNDIRNNNQNN